MSEQMEALTPELSRSAMRLNKEKLQSVPWNHRGTPWLPDYMETVQSHGDLRP